MSRKEEKSWEEYAESISKDPKWSEFKAKLAKLKGNSKQVICNLTEFAKKNKTSNRVIVVCLVKKIIKTEANGRLRYLYLMDSIVKNVGGGFADKFGAHAPGIVASTIKHGSPETQKAVFRLVETWQSDKTFNQRVLDKTFERIKAYQPKRKQNPNKSEEALPSPKRARTDSPPEPQFSPLVSAEDAMMSEPTATSTGAHILDMADALTTAKPTTVETPTEMETEPSTEPHTQPPTETPTEPPMEDVNEEEEEEESVKAPEYEKIDDMSTGVVHVGSHPLTTKPPVAHAANDDLDLEKILSGLQTVTSTSRTTFSPKAAETTDLEASTPSTSSPRPPEYEPIE